MTQSPRSLVWIPAGALICAQVWLTPLAAASEPEPTPPSAPAGADARPADAAPPASNPTSVQLRITPYAWLTGFSGSLDARGLEFDVDLTFGDVLDESDSIIGFMEALDLTIGRFVFQANGAYSEANQSEGRGVAVGRNASADISFDATASNTWLEFLAGYRLIDRKLEGDKHWSVDAFAGIRETMLDLDVSVVADADVTLPNGDVFSRNVRREVDRSHDWIEPFVGARTALVFGGGWNWSIRGDIGGFGVDGSDFAWQVLTGLGYEWAFEGGAFGLFVGGRALGQDYSDDGFAWDVITYGPMLGLSLRLDF